MRSSAKYIWIFIFVMFVGGFLLLQNSGLLGGGAVTPNTVVAEVNGTDVLYTTWAARVQALSNEEAERQGRALTLDEVELLEDRAFNELVSEILLQQEYDRRGIGVTREEIRAAATMMPPPALMQSPE